MTIKIRARNDKRDGLAVTEVKVFTMTPHVIARLTLVSRSNLGGVVEMEVDAWSLTF
jgi:hypothetical protein